MSKALAQVKKELGAAAVIVNTRTFKARGLLGLRRRTVVEITACADERLAATRPRASAAVQGAPKPLAPPPTFGQVVKQTYKQAAASGAATADANRQAALALPVDFTIMPGVNDELRQIRSMVQQMIRRSGPMPQRDLPDALFSQYLALLQQEVTQELADEVIGNVLRKMKDEHLTNEDMVRRAVGQEVASLIPTDAAAETQDRPADGRPLTIALIGPTGVGKTTTLAKLAATFKLRQRRKVALITIDTYRIAAVDQLKTYATIINLPLHVVLTPQEMTDALARCREYDVVLIDTAGRSQRDDSKLDQLGEFIDAANPHQVHLVLSSTCSQQVLMEAVDRFSKARIDRIIFTKLDEAVSFGVLLNVVRKVNKRLSYITTGQEVPHQIEPGRSERLAGLILGQSV